MSSPEDHVWHFSVAANAILPQFFLLKLNPIFLKNKLTRGKL